MSQPYRRFQSHVYCLAVASGNSKIEPVIDGRPTQAQLKIKDFLISAWAWPLIRL